MTLAKFERIVKKDKELNEIYLECCFLKPWDSSHFQLKLLLCPTNIRENHYTFILYQLECNKIKIINKKEIYQKL